VTFDITSGIGKCILIRFPITLICKLTKDMCLGMQLLRLCSSCEYSDQHAGTGCATQVDIRSGHAGRRSVCRTPQIRCREAENFFSLHRTEERAWCLEFTLDVVAKMLSDGEGVSALKEAV
jgi:hypothetical protein